MRVLVTGGAGYVGSHVVRALRAAGHGVAVLDDLSTGHRDFIETNGVPLHEGDVGDPDVLDVALPGVDAVVHLAAKAIVVESVRDPGPYFRTNVEAGRALLEGMLRHGVRRLVFSSSCAVYGQAATLPIDEQAPCAPVSPYGASKLAFELLLAAYARAHGLLALSLRYFNAAGAHPQGDLGERHDPETHLVPLALRAAQGGPPVTIAGTDHPTRDGTCERDLVHVEDLARAHVLALERLDALGPLDARPAGLGLGGLALNLGAGRGISVAEVLAMAGGVVAGEGPEMGRPAASVAGPRRPGDPSAAVADARRARALLGWEATRDLRTIVRDAHAFMQAEARRGAPRVGRGLVSGRSS